MNSRTRARLFPFLSKRDGEFCNDCGKLGSQKSLCIDHIDNNSNNNSLDNLQLLCKSCNTKKNPRGKARNESTKPVELFQVSSKEVALKEKYEPMFREWLENQVQQYNRITMEDAVEAGAEVTGASIQTIERYVRKMKSTAGRFRVAEVDGVKYIEFKEWWNPN